MKHLILIASVLFLHACASVPNDINTPKVEYISYPELGVEWSASVGDEMLKQGNLVTRGGITLNTPYKNTYYILSHLEADLRLHFHELVHVAQWKHLGATPFMQRYMHEIQTFGYNEAPLEEMAYSSDTHFTNNGSPRDIPSYVVANL